MGLQAHTALLAGAAVAALVGLGYWRLRPARSKRGRRQRVCVIGAGPSGLATLRAFGTAESPVPELICYEKQADWGGLWNYNWRTGVDQNGHNVHGSMYKYLWSNAPKECLEFGDYSFEQHFGRNIPSYPPRPVLLDYLTGRARQLRQLVRFNTNVDAVDFDPETQQFIVRTTSTTLSDPANPRSAMAKRSAVERFDYVVCAAGHYSYPNYPEFEGLEQFRGRVLHAHDMRDATEFEGQDVLLVGTSYSAEDIASQLWKYGVKSVAISHRTKPIGYSWPANVHEVPLLQSVASPTGRARGGTARFADGSTRQVDAIILCTGYLHHFPFLSNELRLNPHDEPGQPANKIWLKGLYRGIFWMPNPRLIHIGPHTGFFTFSLFDAQAWLCRDFILGRYELPAVGEQRAYDRMMVDRCNGLLEEDGHGNYDHRCIHFQGDYLAELIGLTDYPSIDVEQLKQRFFEWEHHKEQGIMSFRNNSYKSVVTGKMAPLLYGPDGKTVLDWKDAMADTCESFGLADLFDGNVRKPGA